MKLTDRRTPYDGKPYYCAECGAGFAEFVSCEWTDECRLETADEAETRAALRSALSAALDQASSKETR